MSSKMDNSVMLATIFIMLVGGLVIGVRIENRRMKEEAVKMGAAIWTNDADGNVKFHWTVGI
jgi:hypothetical protein